jgi:hypothetical protein
MNFRAPDLIQAFSGGISPACGIQIQHFNGSTRFWKLKIAARIPVRTRDAFNTRLNAFNLAQFPGRGSESPEEKARTGRFVAAVRAWTITRKWGEYESAPETRHRRAEKGRPRGGK